MQFIDIAEVEVIAGKGGDGMVAFRREKICPCWWSCGGGNGGWGGSVILVASNRLQTLLDFRYARIFKAEDGKKGGPNNCTGAKGSDLAYRSSLWNANYRCRDGENILAT